MAYVSKSRSEGGQSSNANTTIDRSGRFLLNVRWTIFNLGIVERPSQLSYSLKSLRINFKSHAVGNPE